MTKAAYRGKPINIGYCSTEYYSSHNIIRKLLSYHILTLTHASMASDPSSQGKLVRSLAQAPWAISCDAKAPDLTLSAALARSPVNPR